MRSLDGFRLLPVAFLAAAAGAYTPPSAAVSALGSYRGYSELTTAAGSMDLDVYARNLTTWQMSHGGFSKAHASLYVNPYDGVAELSSWTGTSGTPLGTFDNNATVQEMRLLAVRYKAATRTALKDSLKSSFQKAVAFVLASQRSAGCWPQVWPKRGNYSDQATYNDNAMVRVMVLVQDMVSRASPFDTDILMSSDSTKLRAALSKSVTYALKAQIVNSGSPTVWCAQHDTSNYAPAPARAYELESKSGSESSGVVWFLMNWPDQSAEVQAAVKGAIAWYKKNRVANLKSMWYRFYEVATDAYFFCDRDGAPSKTQDITTLSDDRRYGYQWAGDYGSKLLAVESAYLSALGTTAVTTTTTEGTARIAGDRLVGMLPDGAYRIRVLDLSGAEKFRQVAVVTGGRIDLRLEGARPRSGVVRVEPVDGRSATSLRFASP